jgi:hypothetical protein
MKKHIIEIKISKTVYDWVMSSSKRGSAGVTTAMWILVSYGILKVEGA